MSTSTSTSAIVNDSSNNGWQTTGGVDSKSTCERPTATAGVAETTTTLHKTANTWQRGATTASKLDTWRPCAGQQYGEERAHNGEAHYDLLQQTQHNDHHSNNSNDSKASGSNSGEVEVGTKRAKRSQSWQ